MTKIKEIVHSTSIQAYESILGSGRIFDQKDRQKFCISMVGEGTKDRRVGTFDAPLTHGRDFYEEFDEANGVYFRVGTKENPIDFFSGSVQLVFSHHLLDQYPDWIFNTEENFGFVLGEHGEMAESPWSGDEGVTFMGVIDQDIEIIPRNTELLIPHSINLENLAEVRFKDDLVARTVRIQPPKGVRVRFLSELGIDPRNVEG
jgi:hypothetical protein